MGEKMGNRSRGIFFLAAALLIWGLLAAPPASAAWQSPFAFRLVAQNPMEAQMLEEKPFQAQTSSGFTGSVPRGKDGAKIPLPYNLEMGISFRYNQDPALDVSRRPPSSMLFNYSMDYRLLPNLKVGLHGYLYRHDTGESMAFSPRAMSDTAVGLGPGLKYDLGRWSFVLKSQMEANPERGEAGFQNWLRVWYAF
ncbi:MAG: hypothetical protein FJ126_10970 [Deltaproteobacteria bacterium]|nr:hypothetical protein [Deltaproteobacteria bacterium]